MSDLVKINTLFVKLVEQTPEILYFQGHAYLDELNTVRQNIFNQDSKKGRLFPSLDWIVPDEITHDLSESEKEVVNMSLYFQDLQGYVNKGATDTRTRAEVWRDLKKIAKRFILLFNRALCELGYGGIEGRVRYRLGAYWGKMKTQNIEVLFDVVLNTECFDVEGDNIPEVNEDCDLENYCFCTEIP